MKLFLTVSSVMSWQEIFRQWELCLKITTDRLLKLDESESSYELHCFTDASKVAYATVVYLRKRRGKSVNLIYSKARLYPSKGMSIPSLELMGILIGVRALKFVEGELKLNIEKKFLWSDSKTALSWITSTKVLPVFVANRVKEIRSSKLIEYRYIPTQDNPADIASRETTVQELAFHDLWWHSPCWLTEDDCSWPSQITFGETEREEEYVNCSAVQYSFVSTILPAAERVSSRKILKRVIALVLRFLDRLRAKHASKQFKRTISLTVEEVRRGETMIIEHLQQCCFPDLIQDIKRNTSSSLRQQLGIQLVNGILRCMGRMGNADVDFETRYPILLPRKNRVTQLIIEDVHKKQLHAGLQMTLCALRTEWWIPKG
ncbi:hypothetical protein AB6A40_011422, partial [Gnathostoma spinigerum]